MKKIFSLFVATLFCATMFADAKFYVTGNAALLTDANSTAAEWAPNAIPSNNDALVLNLKANTDYKLKVTVNGDWGTGKAFGDLTDKAIGLKSDNDGNICFRLDNAGAVTVTYTASAFTVAGDFTMPTVAIVGNFAGDDSWWVPVAANTMKVATDKKSASVTFNIAQGDYEMKVWVDGTYLTKYGEGGLYSIHRDWTDIPDVNVEVDNNNFKLVADKTGDYTFTWTYATKNLVVTFPTATGIENTNTNANAVKRIINGQLVIEKNGVRFNALGAEVR